jgi:hypothetical protein
MIGTEKRVEQGWDASVEQGEWLTEMGLLMAFREY